MANEIIFNLDIDSKNKVSSFAFRNGVGGTFYFRPYSGQYLTDWSKINSVTLTFTENNNVSNKHVINLGSSNITTINGEQLMEVVLPSAMLNHSALYVGTTKINTAATQPMDILIYDTSTIELELMRNVTTDYENTFYKYLSSIKKDKVGVANGVAVLDKNKKILDSYLPTSYQNHINAKIRTTEVHKIKLDGNGILWYFDSNDNTWKKGVGQNATSTHIPPTLTVEDGKIVIKHHASTVVVLQKYGIGDLAVSYFASQGTPFNGSTITVTDIGMYTYYYKISNGEQYVVAVEVKETDIPFPKPTIAVSNGLATVKHKQPDKVKLQKWALGSLQVGDFETQGTEIVNNQFIVADSGIYTVYYELYDGRKFVQTFLVKESDLPKDVMPTWTIQDGVVTLTYAPHINIAISKWDIGDRKIPYFQDNGIIINNNQFEVTTTGTHTIYFKTVKGNEYVLHFNVRSDQIKPDPVVFITVVKGLVTVQYPSDMFVQLSKWDFGIKNILYFRTGGYVFTGNTFTVEEVGKYTLYFQDERGREYVKVFDVTAAMLPPQIKPRYTKQDGKILISVDNKAIYTQSKYELGVEGKEYFKDNGITVSNWEIPITIKGSYTHYYAVNDGRDGVSIINVTDEDLPHKNPVITVSNGLARVFHDQPVGVTVLEQKWIYGSKTLDETKTNGVLINDNKFYVTQAGVHTLYYALSNGGEYIMTFNVLASQLEKPWTPATISTTNKVTTVTYPSGITPVLQKWDFGSFQTLHFADNGNEFTGNAFNVTQAGIHTLYYKLDNDKEYVQQFAVTEDDLKPKFISPTITIVRGKVTVVYNSSMNVTQTKWIIGVHPANDMDTKGEIVVNNTFNVTEAGTHTLFTQLEGQYAYRTLFEVKPTDLFIPDKPPVITVNDGVVTITHNVNTQVALQKWDYGNNSTGYFENNGNVFTGNTIQVDRAGQYTYYYVNTAGDKHVYPFIVREEDLPFYAPVIEVFDGLLTITFTSPQPPKMVKIASGVHDKAYFQSNGDIITDGKYPITTAGQYTIFWREENDNEYISVITVTQDQVDQHIKPIITVVNVYTVGVEYDPATQALVSLKKWADGNQTVEYFDVAGNVVTDDAFVVSSAGMHTYYYKYRTRGFVQNFYILIPPDIETRFGVTKVTLIDGAQESDIVLRKWAVGVQTVDYFQTDGNTYTGDRFNVTEEGTHTLYMKDLMGTEHVFLFTVTADHLEVPTVNISIVDGIGTIEYDPSYYTATSEKFDIGSRNVDYFKTNGTTIDNHTFTVAEVGAHTLYYVLENDYPFVKEFTVTEDQLPVTANLPIEMWGMSKRYVWEWDETSEMPVTILTMSGVRDVAWFEGGTRGAVPTAPAGFPYTRYMNDSGMLPNVDQTVYVKMANGKEAVKTFKTYQGMIDPPPTPTFTYDEVSKTVTISTMLKPNRTIAQKWDYGQRDTFWFASNGTAFTGNSFTVTKDGWVTLYVKYMTNNEYVYTYNVITTTGIIDELPIGTQIQIPNSNTRFLVMSDRTVISLDPVAYRSYHAVNNAATWIDPADQYSIAYWLNNEYFNNTLTQAARNIIEPNLSWDIEEDSAYPSHMITCAIVPPLAKEFSKASGSRTFFNTHSTYDNVKRGWMGSASLTSGTIRPRYFIPDNEQGYRQIGNSATNLYNIYAQFKIISGTRVKII